MTDEHTSIGELCRHAGEILNTAPGPLKRVRVQAGDMSVELEWPGTVAVQAGDPGAPQADGAAAGTAPADARDSPDAIVIEAPLVGTFYRAISPESSAFVEVGDTVEAGQQVAIIEAMKLMNAVHADRPGRVVEVLVKNGDPVEYGESLFVLEPHDPDSGH
ncbi:acetyl-CoA carboxylase biotin carboxyl carrier protein [Nonomuraea longispora]|uniref:Biotin carboxyl carrier protein of acetyl-CoA carboxylase n=1 Tax=Nonomuraea longispora TaxID=1848320 RepID=A0A4R4NHY3_9ACTN|nr:acetyl-CoA carboxylase biotin carboxyl carrier protein [Nonomuraea longispora]TDC08154.1 acetyl-CoA carboxylase biotin carboxyl carrier protein [Nonomuraea longispora]